MTKAELLRRFQWVILLLPFASAIGFRLVLSLVHATESGDMTFAPPLAAALNHFKYYGGFLVMGWLALTIVCSTFGAYTLAARYHLLGRALGAAVMLLSSFVFISLHVITAMVLLLLRF